MVVESNIDDMSGEIAGYVMEKLFDAGALDVFYTPIHMKKSRPAVKLTVICSSDRLEIIQHMILRETTTIGIRRYKTQRVCMEREIHTVKTPWGMARVKVSSIDNVKKYAPEYEDCKKLAEGGNVPLKDVYDRVLENLNK